MPSIHRGTWYAHGALDPKYRSDSPRVRNCGLGSRACCFCMSGLMLCAMVWVGCRLVIITGVGGQSMASAANTFINKCSYDGRAFFCDNWEVGHSILCRMLWIALACDLNRCWMPECHCNLSFKGPWGCSRDSLLGPQGKGSSQSTATVPQCVPPAGFRPMGSLS